MTVRFRLAAVYCSGLLGLAAVPGCRPPDAATPEHDHGDEAPRVIQVTAVGKRYEIFAEYSPAAAAQPVRFLTHVTDLTTHEPQREGELRFRLQLGQEPALEQIEKTPSRPGIYDASLTFPKPGEWTVAVSVQGGEFIPFPPTRVYATAHDAEHAEVPPLPEGISFLKEQQWRIKLATGAVERRSLVERVAVPATVRAKPGMRTAIMAPIAGVLESPAGAEMAGPGAAVKAGQVLAVIRPTFSEAASRVIEAEAEFAGAKASLQQAEGVLERVRKLRAVEAKSPRELEEAELAAATARARFEAVQLLRSAYTSRGTAKGDSLPLIEVRAPIAGVLNSAAVGSGDLVEPGEPLFVVLNPETVWIEGRIPEVRWGRLAHAQGATFGNSTTPGGVTDILGSGGRLVFAGREVDAATRTVPLIYEVPNQGGRLLVGQSITLQVATGAVREALAIPVSAIIDEAGRPVAYVQVAGETFERRALVLGIEDQGWVQVVEGLTASERVVTQAAFAVRLASMSSALPAHGHAH